MNATAFNRTQLKTNLSIVVQDTAYFICPLGSESVGINRKAFLVRLDSTGTDTAITSIVKSDTIEYFDAGIIKLRDGGMADGVTEIINFFDVSYGILRYNQAGNLLWEKRDTATYPYVSIHDIKERPNGDLVLVGIIRELPPNQGGNQDVLLIKTDSLGNELWKRTYGNTRWEQGYAVDVCRDGGYIVSGLDDGRVWVFKTDSSGNKLWEKRYGNTALGNAAPQGVIQTQDSGYIFTSGWGLNQAGTNSWQYEPWIQKLDSTGDSLWAWKSNDWVVWGYESYATDIHENDDGTLVAVGQERLLNPTDTTLPYKYLAFVVKLDRNGQELWKHHYFHPEASNSFAQHFLYRIEPTPDGGYVTAGYFAAPDTGTQDAWVLKLDSNGCLIPGCIITAVEHEPQLPRGEVLVYPNPARDFITVELGPQRFKDQTFVLFDLQGKRVLERRLNQPISQISLQDLPMGIYLYRVGNVSGKLVVE
jgi:hypothetical protein